MGFGGAAGIRISPGERFVLAGNRNADSISVFQIRKWLVELVHNEIIAFVVSAGFSVYTRWKNGSL